MFTIAGCCKEYTRSGEPSEGDRGTPEGFRNPCRSSGTWSRGQEKIVSFLSICHAFSRQHCICRYNAATIETRCYSFWYSSKSISKQGSWMAISSLETLLGALNIETRSSHLVLSPLPQASRSLQSRLRSFIVISRYSIWVHSSPSYFLKALSFIQGKGCWGSA